MSQQPEPPASIALTLRRLMSKAWLNDAELPVVAGAVWEALLAEGWIAPWTSPQFARVLVIPLPVVEPRDTEQQA